TQQLREAFPWEKPPRYLLRDRDGIFGRDFVDQVTAFGITEVLSTREPPNQIFENHNYVSGIASHENRSQNIARADALFMLLLHNHQATSVLYIWSRRAA